MEMLGASHAFVAAKALLERFARTPLPILIEGETGCGKELAARAVHYTSSRRDMPFVPVNCGAIPDTLIENEFFGHRRGAFTDAKQDQRGFVALAEGGTLFLDELDALSPKGQVVLLRFLQDRVYTQLGADRCAVANVKIVAATNARLADLVEAGTFRSDLYFRLRVLHVVLPPLRERGHDIRLLAQHFLALYAQELLVPPKRLHPNVLEAMERYAWPGNVRELENMLCRACLVADGVEIGFAAVPELAEAGDHRAIDKTSWSYVQAKTAAMLSFESQYISDLMSRAEGNVTRAARLAGTERRHLGRLLKKHSIYKSVGRLR